MAIHWNTDACLNTCESASCGDTHLYEGVEDCDDGNALDGDYCSDDCQSVDIAETGYYNPLLEECDDGNMDNTDGCVSQCELAKCGDGFKRRYRGM